MLTLLPILFNIILEVPARVIRQETDRKCIWIRKEDIILSVFRIQDTTYRNPEVYQKTFRANKQSQQSCKIQNQHKKTTAFLYTNNRLFKKEIKETIQSTTASKWIKYFRITLTRWKVLNTENYQDID